MRLFGLLGTDEPSSVTIAERTVTEARAKRDRLQMQLTDAQGELTQRKAGAAAAALDHGQDVDEWGASIAAQAATTDALTAALNVAQHDLADAKAKLAYETDQAQRTKSVAEIRRRVDAIPGLSASVIAELEKLIDAFKPPAEAYDVCTVYEWLRSAARDVPAMVEHGAKKLNDHARLIEAGGGRATLPATLKDPEVPVATSAPALRTICLLHSARWTCPHSGLTRWGARGWDCELLNATAQRAIDRGLGIPEFAEQAMQLRRERGAPPIGSVDVPNLDDENVAPPAPPPEKWIGPSGIVRYEQPIKTSATLSSWTGAQTQTWMQPHDGEQ